jgi:RHS repeat-associated protein
MLTDGRNTYTWNSEDQLKTAAGVTYTYDGDGHRVEKSNGKLYWYGTGSDPLMETDLSGNLTDEYIFFGGKRIARRDSSSNVVYYAADHLGTSRVVASSAGAIVDQSDFYPFGGERVLSASSGNTYKFTSKERDSESNLDNFGARYDSSILGRFMSSDPKAASAHMVDPQSWNRYAYTLNNPMKYVDPNGLDIVLAAGLSQGDRSYVVNNLARMYATPAGKAMLQRADQSKFTITIGTGHLGRTDLPKAPPGAVVFGGQTKVEGGSTRYDVAASDGHTVLVAKSPDSPTASPIQVIIDKDQSSEIAKDPAKVFGHELGGHTADVINAAEGNANQYIDGVNPKDESSSEAAEKAMGKVPNQPSPEDIQAVEELLKPKAAPQQ